MKSYRQALLTVTGDSTVDPAYQPEKVMAAVEQTLRTRFSFEARAFGQPAMLSEVITVMQAVPGVVAVDVDKLYGTDQATALNPRLVAELPIMGTNGEMVAAELLMLDPQPLNELVVKS